MADSRCRARLGMLGTSLRSVTSLARAHCWRLPDTGPSACQSTAACRLVSEARVTLTSGCSHQRQRHTVRTTMLTARSVTKRHLKIGTTRADY